MEFVVGAVRAFELLDPPPSTLVLADWAARLGQDLFYPPNVGGWPGGPEPGSRPARSSAGPTSPRPWSTAAASACPSRSTPLALASQSHGRSRDEMIVVLRWTCCSGPSPEVPPGSARIAGRAGPGVRRAGLADAQRSAVVAHPGLSRGPGRLKLDPHGGIFHAHAPSTSSPRGLRGFVLDRPGADRPRLPRPDARAPPRPESDGRVLVVVQLDGGNDGINTVVPFADEGYAKYRKALRLPTKQLIKVDGEVGLHPAMREAGKLLESGRLAIVPGVGYPNPSRSHFESMAIWQSARLDERGAQRAGLARPGLRRGSADPRRAPPRS